MGRSLRERAGEGNTALGAALMMPCPYGAELVLDAGYDFVMVDCQHGLVGFDGLVPVVQVLRWADTTVLVRVRHGDLTTIGPLLDAGVDGVIVPMVGSRTEAEEAVDATRFPPGGRRSFGIGRAVLLRPGSPHEVDRQLSCVVMIETPEGVDAADEICSTPGVDGVMLGPHDLALCSGVEPDSAEVEQALSRVVQIARARHLFTMIATSPATVGRRAAEGYDGLLIAADYRLLHDAALQAIGLARESLKEVAR